MKDEAQARRVGGGGGCHSRSPAPSAAITAPRPPPPPAAATRPGDLGGALRNLGARALHAHLPPRGDTEKPGPDRVGGEGGRGQGKTG